MPIQLDMGNSRIETSVLTLYYTLKSISISTPYGIDSKNKNKRTFRFQLVPHGLSVEWITGT